MNRERNDWMVYSVTPSSYRADYRRISRVDTIQIAQFNLNNKSKFIIYKNATKMMPGNINSRFKKGGVTAALEKLIVRESINRRLDLIIIFTNFLST